MTSALPDKQFLAKAQRHQGSGEPI